LICSCAEAVFLVKKKLFLYIAENEAKIFEASQGSTGHESQT
jgi:hypothetical protein